MAKKKELKAFNVEINHDLLEQWKRTINNTDKIRDRVEESLRDNLEQHENKENM